MSKEMDILLLDRSFHYWSASIRLRRALRCERKWQHHIFVSDVLNSHKRVLLKTIESWRTQVDLGVLHRDLRSVRENFASLRSRSATWNTFARRVSMTYFSSQEMHCL